MADVTEHAQACAIEVPPHARPPWRERHALPVYLQQHYAWAYLSARNARLFDTRGFLQLLLFGHYRRLGQAAVNALCETPERRLLQLGCAYGDLSPRLARHPVVARLDVVDAAQLQLDLLRRKLRYDDPLVCHRQDATRLSFPDASFDGVLLFFLLHELPGGARRRALAEALRVCRPGGRVVVIDYHRPHAWHPLRWLLPALFGWLEPFALSFWGKPLGDLLPQSSTARVLAERYWFGRLYRQVTLTP